MIRYFRDNIQGNFAKIFIILICIPFVMFGVDSFFTSSQNPKLAKVNGENIKLAETQREMERLLGERKRQLGDAFDPTNFDEQTLQPQAVGRLIKRKVLEQATESEKLALSSAEVDKNIVTQTVFHQNGQFSQGLYVNLLRSNNLSPTIYKELVAQDLAIQQLSSAISSSQFLTQAELDQYIRFEYQNRDMSYFIFDANNERDNATVSSEQVEAYYQEHLNDFMSEETVNIAYVELKLEDFYQPVSEQDLQQAYEQQIAEMVLPTQRKAAHILINNKTTGVEILSVVQQRLAAGEDFAALAAEVSEDQGSAANGGELGYSTGELFPAEFEAALASLSLNEVSAPIETSAGIHLIKLLDEKTENVPSFESLRDGISAELQKLQAFPEFEESLERLKDLAFDSAAIAELAADLKLNVQQSGHFPRVGANSGLFANASLVNMAFSDEVRIDGRISSVNEITAEHYLVAQLQERKEPQQKDLSLVSAVIEQKLKDMYVADALNEKASQANAAIASGSSIDEVAASFGLTVTSVEGVTRRDMPETDRDVVFAGFRTDTSTLPAYDSYTRNDGSVAILSVGAVNYGTQDSVDEQTKTSLALLLERSYGGEAFNSFDAALNEAAKIKLL